MGGLLPVKPLNGMIDTNNVKSGFEAIAKAEVARHRTRLHSLTPQQIAAVEALLISAANEISCRLTKLIQDYPSSFLAGN